MLREQVLLSRIINEMGDEFNEYIKTFYVCDLWKIKEGELIVNKTFKKLVDIIADYNLTSSEKILSNTYHLIESNEVMMRILAYLCDDFVRHGNDSLLNRSMVFCYALFMITHTDGRKATDVLYDVVNSEVMMTKESLWQKIKHKLGITERPYLVKGDPDAILIISILKGKSIPDTISIITEYKDLI